MEGSKGFFFRGLSGLVNHGDLKSPQGLGLWGPLPNGLKGLKKNVGDPNHWHPLGAHPPRGLTGAGQIANQKKHHGVFELLIFWLQTTGGGTVGPYSPGWFSKPLRASSVAKSMSGAYAEVTFVLSKKHPEENLRCVHCPYVKIFHRILHCFVPSTKWPKKTMPNIHFQAGVLLLMEENPAPGDR